MTSASIQYHFSQAYQPFYLSFLAVCLILAWMVFGRVHANIGRELENRAFRRVILIYVIYILVDLVWVLRRSTHRTSPQSVFWSTWSPGSCVCSHFPGSCLRSTTSTASR